MVSRSQLRYRWEWIDLPVALLISLFLGFFLTIITLGLFLFWLTLGITITLIFTYVANKAMPLGMKVSRENHPDISRMCDQSAERLSMGRPGTYVSDANSVNAFSRGMFSPIIVLHGGLVDLMDEDELMFVIGHEMGHIKMKHSMIKTLFESGMIRVPLILYPPIFLFRILFLRGRVSRSMEYTADRAGLHAVGDVRAAVRCLIKLSTRSRDVDRSDVDEALGLDLKDIAGIKRSRLISRTLSSHPDGLRRIEELVRYSRRTGIGWPDN